ncbi:MAG: hypothetical protein HUJ71_09480 [Pseudobutyrivibrio sp.]|nr:hypothetical protein [Pseudobutyrivibrio sp.]
MKKDIALCDLDMDYITRFASYLMGKRNSSKVELHIFTTPESFFSDEGDYDVGLMTSDFMEVMDFKTQGNIRKRYLLSEDNYNKESELDWVYKYQSMEAIIQAIPEIQEELNQNVQTEEIGKRKPYLMGVFSPMSHELQLPFAMALCDSIKNQGRILFLDLEEISILSSLLNTESDSNLMDLIYELSTNKTLGEDAIKRHINQFMGMDYISPFINPDDLVQIGEAELLKLYEAINQMGYETVVLLLGRAVPGFTELLSHMDQLIMLSKPGDYYNKGSKVFLDYINRSGINANVTEVKLSMSAGNLKDGTYCIEELLTGNLGLFVRKLLEDGTVSFGSQLAYAG